MKYIILTILLGVLSVADEMDRMESIVLDIENLRSDYNRCIKELNIENTTKMVLKTDVNNTTKLKLEENTKMMQEYKELLDKEKLKNTLLLAKIDALSKNNLKKATEFN